MSSRFRACCAVVTAAASIMAAPDQGLARDQKPKTAQPAADSHIVPSTLMAATSGPLGLEQRAQPAGVSEMGGVLDESELPAHARQLLAQVPSGGTIREIRIEGTERIEPDTVRSYLTVQAGDAFDGDRIDKSLKALFATGLFADVTLRRDGDTLMVKVVENPIINRLAFEGNRHIEDKQLQGEVQLRPRVVYTRTRVQADVKRLLDLYRRSGRFAATVEPKIIQLPQNRVDLVFEIDEGALTGINSINFVGNRRFDNSRLLEVIQTRESRWYRLFSTDDNYDPDRLTLDRELLRKFYLANGYADFRVVSAVAELSPSRDGFFVTFTLDEGERYKFGKVDVTSQLKDLKSEQLQPLLISRPGGWYDAEQVEGSITSLQTAVGNLGYAFVDIKPNITRNRESRTVDVTYEVAEGPRVFVERIDITGNVRTLDPVIRRELSLVEGDAFNSSKLQRSQQNLKNLGFFKKADITPQPGTAPDKTVLAVDVEEQSTGDLSLGAGFSTSQGLLGNISIRERNFLGRGQDLRIGFTLAQRDQQLDLSFTEPYFLDLPIAAGFDLFDTVRTDSTRQSYDQDSLGGALRMGYQLTENLRQTLKYTLRKDKISNVASTASIYIQQQTGQRLVSEVGQVLTYDRRDNRLDPTRGFFVSFGSDFAGIGGQVDYVRGKIQGGYYYSVYPEWVLSTTAEAGMIRGLSQDIKLQDRFFVGGDSLRGFKTSGVGPRDYLTDDSLGGNTYYIGSVALGFPLGLPKEVAITGRVFTDFGSLFDIDQKGSTIADNKGLRASAGVGVSWGSPFGPIRLDVARPYIRQKYDQTELFRVSFGTRF